LEVEEGGHFGRCGRWVDGSLIYICGPVCEKYVPIQTSLASSHMGDFATHSLQSPNDDNTVECGSTGYSTRTSPSEQLFTYGTIFQDLCWQLEA